MGILRNPFLSPEELDLRRPRIPKAPTLPRIPGPRGGPAYHPDPRDERPASPPRLPERGAVSARELARSADAYDEPALPSLPSQEEEKRSRSLSEMLFGNWLGLR